jgi:hypothetical protein
VLTNFRQYPQTSLFDLCASANIMRSILEHLKDPSWWFTTILGGIIASLIAGYLQLPIGKFLSPISSGVKKWHIKREELFESRAHSMAINSTLMLMNFLRGIALLMFALFFMGLFVGAYLFSKTAEGTRFESIILMVVSGLGIIKISYRAMYRFRSGNRAEYLYRTEKKPVNTPNKT